MKTSIRQDITINVILPVFFGCFIYWQRSRFSGFALNQLPDGLWAYAFISAILIVWKRQFNTMWLLIAFITFPLFEIFQYLHVIYGTGDIWDVLVYFISGYVALVSNKYFFYINKSTK